MKFWEKFFDRIGVGGRLLLAFLGISGFAALGAATGIYAFLQMGKALEHITQERVPAALAAQEVSRQAERIVAAAPVLLTVQTDKELVERARKIRAEVARLDTLVGDLKKLSSSLEADDIDDLAKELAVNLSVLESLILNRLSIVAQKRKRVEQLLKTDQEIKQLLEPWVLVTEARISKWRATANNSNATIGERTSAGADVKEALAWQRALQDVQLILTSASEQLQRLATGGDANSLKLTGFRLNLLLRKVNESVPQLDAKLAPQVSARLKRLSRLSAGPDSIPDSRKQELAIIAEAEQSLRENAGLSERLTGAVNGLVERASNEIASANREAAAVQRFTLSVTGAAIALSLISSGLIVWLYVGRNLVARLTALSDSMLAIAGGNLKADLPAAGGDEIGRMAEALTIFRDTAVEIEEQNLREIATARQRLIDAIESTNEGFLLCDAEDRVVMANDRYLEMYPGIADLAVPGTPYESIVRAVVDRKLVGADDQDPESWIEQRLGFHRNPKGTHLYQLQDGRWVQVTERKTDAGGTVSVFADITDLKESERRAAAANHLITQSLRYASRIQAAILPAREELADVTNDHFLIWEPRDIVGGDFFWFQKIPDGYAMIVGDCTGHGVPGAFMTLVAWGLLDRMLQSAPADKPSEVLSGLHEGVQALLGQHHEEGETDDGLEAGICFVNEKMKRIYFSGARFSLWHANGKAVKEIKGDRAALGYRRYPADTVFHDVSLNISNGSAFYMTTDGLIDQIGGPRGRSFGKRRFRSFVKRNHGRPMAKQSESLTRALVKYQGDEVRRDDLTVLGFVP